MLNFDCSAIERNERKLNRSNPIATLKFKNKYITQPTVTQADTIVKALDDLTQALKGKTNQQG